MVFARVAAAEQQGSSFGGVFDAGEVPGGDEVAAQLSGSVEESSKLEVLVAHHAGVRRPSSSVFFGEVADDAFLEFGRFVDEVVGNAEAGADAAGVHDRLGSTAFVLGAVDAVLRPQLEGDPHDFESLLLKQGRRGRGIDAAAHAYQYSLSSLNRVGHGDKYTGRRAEGDSRCSAGTVLRSLSRL